MNAIKNRKKGDHAIFGVKNDYLFLFSRFKFLMQHKITLRRIPTIFRSVFHLNYPETARWGE